MTEEKEKEGSEIISNLKLADIFEGVGNIINVVSNIAEENAQVSTVEEFIKQQKKDR